MSYRLPTVREYYVLKYSGDMNEIKEIIGNIIQSGEGEFSVSGYIASVEDMRKNDPKLRVPFYPEKDEKHYFSCDTSDIKAVSGYTGQPFNEVFDMDILSFWAYLHDAVVWSCERTEEGREYLENAWYYEQTKADRGALREIFGGGRNG